MTIPPLHPIVVHFPIALLILSVLADLSARWTKSATLRGAGWWSLFAAALTGVVTVATGLYDMYRMPLDPVAHKYVDFHMTVGFAVLASAALLTLWRGVLWYRDWPLNSAYLTAGVLVMALIGFQGFLGGELVYSYGVGVAPAGISTENVAEAQSRMKAVETVLGPFEAAPAHRHDLPGEAHPKSIPTTAEGNEQDHEHERSAHDQPPEI